LEIAKNGGNITDVVIATAFALAVERPHSLGLGGGGFLTLSLVGKAPVHAFVDFRETAPLQASREMYLDSNGEVIPRLSSRGILSVATPGFVPGLYAIHKKWGKLSWKSLLQPAIRLAREGFPIYYSLAKSIEEEKEELRKDPYTESLLFQNQKPLQIKQILVQKDLSHTLERIAENPETDFKSGKTAQLIDSFVRKKGGLLTLTDLKRYRPVFRSPLFISWKGMNILSAPPPSAGGVMLTEMLNMLSKDKLSLMDDNSYLHLLAEVMKRAYADRSRFIGDPDFVQQDIRPLLTEQYGHAQRNSISMERATPSTEIVPGALLPKRGKHTTHLSVIDSDGNGAAMTLTINDHFGSRLAVPGTGIFLNDEMDDFSSKPGAPNVFGLIGDEANSIQPLKRPASSMSPTLVIKNGRTILAVGAAGGSKITSNVFEVILNVFERFPGDLKKSIFQPRIHHQWLPDQLQIEPGFAPEVLEALKSKGHIVLETKKAAIVQAVFSNAQGELRAVYDPRDEGGAESQ
jgi:gamma-glutamyltranspeptidase/glutathione hydrolase